MTDKKHRRVRLFGEFNDLTRGFPNLGNGARRTFDHLTLQRLYGIDDHKIRLQLLGFVQNFFHGRFCKKKTVGILQFSQAVSAHFYLRGAFFTRNIKDFLLHFQSELQQQSRFPDAGLTAN